MIGANANVVEMGCAFVRVFGEESGFAGDSGDQVVEHEVRVVVHEDCGSPIPFVSQFTC